MINRTQSTLTLSLLLLVLFVGIVSSASFTFKQDEPVNYEFTCLDTNNNFCGTDTPLQISIIYEKNGTPLFRNSSMTGENTYFNHTLPTEYIGSYSAIIISEGTGNATSEFTYEVNPTGSSIDSSDAIIFAIIISLMFGVSLFFLIVAKQTETDGVRLFFMLVSYLVVILSAGAGRVLIDYTPVSSGIGGLSLSFLFVLGTVFVLVMYYVFLNQTRRAIELMRAKRGFPQDNDPEYF